VTTTPGYILNGNERVVLNLGMAKAELTFLPKIGRLISKTTTKAIQRLNVTYQVVAHFVVSKTIIDYSEYLKRFCRVYLYNVQS
jgi:hypothetical protein